MKHIIWIAATTLIIIACHNTPPVTTEPETRENLVTGIIMQPDGITPAPGVSVMIRPKNFLIEPSERILSKRTSVKDSTTTDNSGVFSFDTTLESGIYLIEAIRKNDIALIDSVTVTDGQSVTTPTAVLQPAGSLKGSILLPQGESHQDIYILAFGVDRFVQADEDGSFRFDNLGEGTYSIRIVSFSGNYEAFDTAEVVIVSADTTDLGPITLHSNSLPSPQNLTCTYDTSSLTVTLFWNKITTHSITGYTVYRRVADDNRVFSKVNIKPSPDTSATDQVVQGFRYEYRVAAVDENDKESIKSSSVFVTAASYFPFDTAYPTEEKGLLSDELPVDFAVATNGDLYFINQTEKCINVFDKNMHTKQRIGEGIFFDPPIEITIDENGLLIVLCRRETIGYTNTNGSLVDTSSLPFSHLYFFSSAGEPVGGISDTSFTKCRLWGFDAKDSLLYFIGTRDTSGSFLSMYTYNGELHRKWDLRKHTYRIVKGNDDRLFLDQGRINVYDTLGNLLATQITTTITNARYRDIEFDAANNCLYLLTGSGINRPDVTPMSRAIVMAFDDEYHLTATATSLYRKTPFSAPSNSSMFSLSHNGELVVFFHYYNDADLVRFNPLSR